MKKRIRIAIVAAATLFCLAPLAFGQSSPSPPEVISVTDPYYPYLRILDGFVVLEVSIDAKGEVRKIRVLRDPGSMVPVAISSVRTWKFKPPGGAAGSRPSKMTIVFCYRPPVTSPMLQRFNPVLPDEEPDRSDYSPAGIVSVAYPGYPVNSIRWGSVVLQMTVDKTGKAEEIRALQDLVPFTQFAVSVLKEWQFKAARYRGQPVESKVAVAFVFQTITGTP